MATLVTVAKFREDLPEFASEAKFPSTSIAYWLAIAPHMVSEARWGAVFDNGIEMFIAHHVVLEAEALEAANKGGMPGKNVGIINNKSVDKVSVGYDTQSGAELNAGHWNLTTYGTRFIRTARMMGAGPVQVGIGGHGRSVSAWPGPWQSNFPNQS